MCRSNVGERQSAVSILLSPWRYKIMMIPLARCCVLIKTVDGSFIMEQTFKNLIHFVCVYRKYVCFPREYVGVLLHSALIVERKVGWMV